MNTYKLLCLFSLFLVCTKRVLVALLSVKALHAAFVTLPREGESHQDRYEYLRAYFIWSALRTVFCCGVLWCLIQSDAFAFVFSFGGENAKIGEVLIFDGLLLLVALRFGSSAWVNDRLCTRYHQVGGHFRDWVRMSFLTFVGVLYINLLIFLMDAPIAETDTVYIYIDPVLLVSICFAIITGICFAVRFFERRSRPITVLEDGPLKERALQLAQRVRIHIRYIQVYEQESDEMSFNASCRSFGRFAWLAFSWSTLEALGEDAALADLAHELGHAKYRDYQRDLIMFLVGILLPLILWFVTRHDMSLFSAFGFSSRSLVFSFALFFSCWHFVMSDVILCIPLNWYKRRAETRADAFAVDAGLGEQLYKSLRHGDDTVIPVTDKWLIRLTYSHPELSVRLADIKKRMAE